MLIFAQDATYTGCGDIESKAVNIPASTTYSWCDPLDFQSGGTGACGTDPAIGWYAPTGFHFASVPSGWLWGYATFEYMLSCSGVNWGGTIDPIGCTGWGNPTYGCGGTQHAQWNSTMGGNVTIALY